MASETLQYSFAQGITSPVGADGIEPYSLENDAAWAPAEGVIPLEWAERALATAGVSHLDQTHEELVSGDLGIDFSDIGLTLSAPITTFRFDRQARRIHATVDIDAAASLSLEIIGDLAADGAEFNPRQISFRVLPANDLARSHFFASTLSACFTLINRASVTISGGRVTFGASRLELREISNLLLTRETSFRLMIIGKAIGEEFEFPPQLSGAEVQTINFVRHAITDRTFVWPTWRYPLILRADESSVEKIKACGKPRPMAIPEPISVALLGHEIHLGMVNTILEEAIIEDSETVLAEASKLDGREIQAVARSLAGRATIECPEAPALPPNPWTATEQVLISLDNELVTRITDRYNALAASTLEGLNEEEKEALTNPKPSFAELLIDKSTTAVVEKKPAPP